MPKSNRAAYVPHSVRYSNRAFVEGPNGLPMPNVDRFEASPFTCFADGDPGTGEGTPPAPPPEKTFTQAELNNIIARETKKSEAKAKADADAAAAAMRQELEQLKIQVEEAGKTATEKEKAAAQRERAALEEKLSLASKTIAEREALAAKLHQDLRDTRLDHEITSLFGARKVMPEAMRAAQLVFRADAKVEYGEDGNVAAVDVGTKRFSTVTEAIDDWMKTNGALYVAAPSGGAGTRVGNGASPGKKLSEMSDDELIALGDQQRSQRR